MAEPTLHIRPFQPGDASAFRDLNEQWILKYFSLEESDRVTLGHPESSVLQPGGHIFMAMLGDIPVGCCALLADGPGVFELGKMAVMEGHRGLGIGRKILEHVIAQARALGARSLHLGTHSKLAGAIHLYETVGFRHVPPDQAPASPYARAEVFMDLQLQANKWP